MKLGKWIIDNLLSYCQKVEIVGEGKGCHRVVLGCQTRFIKFYEKCGMHVRGTEMAIYYKKKVDGKPSKKILKEKQSVIKKAVDKVKNETIYRRNKIGTFVGLGVLMCISLGVGYLLGKRDGQKRQVLPPFE